MFEADVIVDQLSDLWIDVPHVPPPVVTRPQELPMESLPWECFERLCLRLASEQGPVIDCRRYGKAGQAQEGIDLYVRYPDNRYSTWQCKRYKTFGSTDIEEAVAAFLKGDWAGRSKIFHLAVSASLSEVKLADAIEGGAKACSDRSIDFIPLDKEKLSTILKGFPRLVDDFFGRAWVAEFCGSDAAAQLSNRVLSSEQRIRARGFLRSIYSSHFAAVDTGLPSTPATTGTIPPRFSLVDRFIVPQVESIATTEADSAPKKSDAAEVAGTSSDWLAAGYMLAPRGPDTEKEQPRPRGVTPRALRAKVGLLEWLQTTERGLILGGPGLGKSACLRFIALDLLSDCPRREGIARRWGSMLPIFVPFAALCEMIHKGVDGGIPEFLGRWLRKLSAPEEVIQLLKDALGDERILLLVDGLDEWHESSEASAALVMLLDFCTPRNLSMLASSRKTGFDQLSGINAEWQVADLLAFDRERQLEFIKNWFQHFHQVQSTDTPSSLLAVAIQDADSFMRELSEDENLSQLSSVPLLLSALLYLRLRGRSLPHDRFEAMQSIATVLIEEQPRRRSSASLLGPTGSGFTQRYALLTTEFLAFRIHNSVDSITLPRPVARTAIAELYSKNFQRTSSDAVDLADEYLSRVSQDVGIVVEDGAGNIAIMHRSLQEFLAAKEIMRWPFVELVSFVKEKAGLPEWQEVLIALFHLVPRTDEVDQLLSNIRKDDYYTDPHRAILLARAVFSDCNCSPRLAHELAEHFLSLIEKSEWMPLRRRLLEEAMAGLDSEILSSAVGERLRKWFPRQGGRWGLLLELVKKPSTTLREGLIVSLFNAEGSGEGREVAKALANGSGTWPELGDLLATLLLKPCEPDLSAAALGALASGWPNHPRLETILAQAANSGSDKLRLVAQIGRALRGETSREVVDFLSEAVGSGRFDIYPLEDDLLKAIVKISDSSPEPRTKAIEAASSKDPGHAWSRAFALTFLVSRYPNDQEVARLLSNLILEEKPIFLSFDNEGIWEPLFRGFTGNPIVVAAVEARLEGLTQPDLNEPDIARLAVLAKTRKCFDLLIGRLGTIQVFNSWVIAALLEIDKSRRDEIRLAISAFTADKEHLGLIANFLPAIYDDRDSCRKLLLELSETVNGFEVPRTLYGLSQIGALDSADALAIVQRRLEKDSDGRYWSNAKYSLLQLLPGLSIVKEKAIEEFEGMDPPALAIAKAYPDDPDIRLRLERMLFVLHEDLRVIIADSLHPNSRRSGVAAAELLRSYRREFDPDARVTAARAYCAFIRAEDASAEGVRLSLLADLNAVGLHFEAKRQAAFPGLLALGDVDRLKSLVPLEAISPHDNMMRMIAGSSTAEWRRSVVESWELLCDAYGPPLWQLAYQFPALGTGLFRAGKLSDKVFALTEGLETLYSNAANNIESFRFLEEIQSGTTRFSEFCMARIASSVRSNAKSFSMGYPQFEVMFEAAHYISRAHAGVPIIQTELEAVAANSFEPDPAIVALCIGWPASPYLADVWSRRPAGPMNYDIAPAWLMSTFAPASDLLDYIRQLPRGLRVPRFGPRREIIAAVLSRLRRDQKSRDLLLSAPNSITDPDLVSIVAYLAKSSSSRPTETQQWAEQVLSNMNTQDGMPVMALDPTRGVRRPLVFVILEATFV